MLTAEARTGVALQFDDAEQRREAATLGMWAFLATEVLFFGVLFAAYTVSRLRFPEAFAQASRHTDLLLGGCETAVLITSSATMSLALRGVRVGAGRAARVLLAVTALLGIAFVCIHGLEYYHEYGEHLVPGLDFSYDEAQARGVELFFWLYYVMTGFHVLHVLIGVVVISLMWALVRRRRVGPDYDAPVELTGLYWSFVDIVWIFLFPTFYLVARP
jgi:cytochrome c oxidase subunit 3